MHVNQHMGALGTQKDMGDVSTTVLLVLPQPELETVVKPSNPTSLWPAWTPGADTVSAQVRTQGPQVETFFSTMSPAPSRCSINSCQTKCTNTMNMAKGTGEKSSGKSSPSVGKGIHPSEDSFIKTG